MASFLHAFCLLSIWHLVSAQSAADTTMLTAVPSDSLTAVPSAVASVYVDSTMSDLGILQLVTPTTHANQVAATAIDKLYDDVASFYTSYTQIDPFDLNSALIIAIQSQPLNAQPTLVADQERLIPLLIEEPTSLLVNPTAFLSRLHNSVSAFPPAFSSSLLSQATGLLLGFESIVSQNILSKTPTSGPITPGMSISVGPAVTSASSPGGSKPGATKASVQATETGKGTVASTATSQAKGVPLATGSPLLMVNAALAAVGVLGAALL
ncbi:hypothetical protein MMC14_002890 [Varicellaria rhodocarpa]|nr:hypothetical protein [Varicellaria rhodocarpa]